MDRLPLPEFEDDEETNRWDSLGNYYEGDLNTVFEVGEMLRVARECEARPDPQPTLWGEPLPEAVANPSVEAPNGWGQAERTLSRFPTYYREDFRS